MLFLVIFVGGYWHAQRRMRKGLPPLAYHRVRLSQMSSIVILTTCSGFSRALSVLGFRRRINRSVSTNTRMATMMDIK